MSELDRQTEQPKVVAAGSQLLRRRRFVRGAGLAVPVVLTVSSRSAMAAVSCLSPSASASINLTHSRPLRNQGSCSGQTPLFWSTASQGPNGDNTAKDQPFDGIYSSGYAHSMEWVCALITPSPSLDDQFGAYLAAAWCNFAKGWVPTTVLTLAELQLMWSNGRLGIYQPVPGVHWGMTDIIAYLKTTIG